MSDQTDRSLSPGSAAHTEHAIEVASTNLAREYGGRFNPETVQRFVRDSFAMLSGARVRSFVPVFAERFARDRLRALTRAEARSGSDIPHVLFLCVHNAGRSQMAAGWMKHLAAGRVAVYSGGSEPADAVNHSAVEAMSEVDIDIAEEFPKPWTDEVVQAADVVVTMGCGDACPVFPGTRYVDWELDDPAGQSVAAVRPIRDDIRGRVEALLAELGVPVESTAAGGQ